MRPIARSSAALILVVLASAAQAQEDSGPGAPTFREGDVITADQLEAIRPFVPPEFWSNRDFFFYEGMQLEIGPFHRDYSSPPVYQEATKKYSEAVRLGPSNSLVDYRAGQPFPMEEIDCLSDPDAGAKIAWNFIRRWEGAGGKATFYYSYWDRGEELPLYYEGNSAGVSLAYRPEPQYEEVLLLGREWSARPGADLVNSDRCLATVCTTGHAGKPVGKVGPRGIEGVLRNRRLTLQVSGQQGPHPECLLGQLRDGTAEPRAAVPARQ